MAPCESFGFFGTELLFTRTGLGSVTGRDCAGMLGTVGSAVATDAAAAAAAAICI